MKNITFFTFCVFLCFLSCKESGPHPASMVGLYEVRAQLKDGTVDTEDITKSVSDAMKDVKTEMQKARNEID